MVVAEVLVVEGSVYVKQGDYESKDERQVCPVTRRSLSQCEFNKGLISSSQITCVLERWMLIRLISIVFFRIMTWLGKKMGTDLLWLFVLHSFKHCKENTHDAPLHTTQFNVCMKSQP